MRISVWSSDVCSSDLGSASQRSGVGRGRIAVTLNQPGTAAPLTASADLADVRVRPEPGAAPVTAEHLTMELEGQDVAFVEPGALAVTATGLRWDRLALERIEATATEIGRAHV